MDTLNKNQPTFKDDVQDKTTRVADAAGELLNEGKKFANELYKEGVNQVSDVGDNVKECSDKLLKMMQNNPLASVLIAGGIGFVLSAILKK